MIEPPTVCEVSDGDRELLRRAAAWGRWPALADCPPSIVRNIAVKHGLDFATALLYGRVLRDPGHAAFFTRVMAADAPAAVQPVLVGIVPGAFYRNHKNTGAGGARLMAIAKALNCPVEQIPVRSFGSLSVNAALIADWLKRHENERVILLSLSKGGADLKTALALPNAPELFRNVAAWISISGLLPGTPLVAWLRRHPWRRIGVTLLLHLRGQRYSVVEELRHDEDGPLANWPALPPHLRVVHLVAFPLRRHLAHPWAARAYERIAFLGPNDGGGFLLADVTSLPGTVFPVWGVDHYLQPASWDADAIFRRVLAAVIASPPEPRHANQSAAQPSNPPASKSSA